MVAGRHVMEWLSIISRWILAIVFVFAGLPKLFAPNDFATIIAGYGILPEVLLYPAAVVIPLVELVTAVGLIMNRQWAVISTIVLYVSFMAMLSYGIHLGLDIDCGCFGPEDPEHDVMVGLKTALYRDILLMIPALYTLWFVWSRKLKYRKGENQC